MSSDEALSPKVRTGRSSTAPKVFVHRPSRRRVVEDIYRQANPLAQSAQQLEITEKRLVTLGLSKINHNEEHPSLEVVVPVKRFEDFGIRNAYDRVRNAAESLPTRVVYIPDPDGSFEAIPWLQRLEYVRDADEENEHNESYVRITFNEELRPLLTGLTQQYAVLPLEDTMAMPTVQSARLYEILASEYMWGLQPVVEYELSHLKFLLDLAERDEVKSKKAGRPIYKNVKYKQWRDFRKQLLRAIGEFDKHGRLKVDLEGVRPKGKRRIEIVRFTITLQREFKALGIQPTIFENAALTEYQQELSKRMTELGFTGNNRAMIETYGEEVVDYAVTLTEEKKANGKLDSPGGFLRTILEDGTAAHQYAAQQEAQAAAEARKRDLAKDEGVEDEEGKEDAADDVSENQVHELELKLSHAWREYRNSVVEDLIEERGLTSEEVQAMVEDAIAARNPNPRLRKSLAKGKGFVSQRARIVLDRFRDSVPEEALDIEAFDRTFGILDDVPDDVREMIVIILNNG